MDMCGLDTYLQRPSQFIQYRRCRHFEISVKKKEFENNNEYQTK